MGGQSLEVLVVDDQAGVRYLLDAIVKEEGHKSHLASNGMEAVEQVKILKPDLIFMDIRMPVMDGTTALAKMNELGYSPDVVIMTAFTEKDVIDDARKKGAFKCIIKPFDVDDIRQILREAAQKCRPKLSAV